MQYVVKPELLAGVDEVSADEGNDRGRIQERMYSAIEKKGEVVSEEFRFRMPDGTYRHFYDRAYIKYDPAGKPVRKEL